MTSQNYDYFVMLCLSQGNTCRYVNSGVCVAFPQLRNVTRYLGGTETVVFSVAGGSPLYTLLIATEEAIYKVPVNNSVTPPTYGNKTKLITGKLI